MRMQIRLILLGLAVLLVGHADDTYYKGKIYVPYEGLPDVMRVRKRAVLMGRVQFEALLRKAKRAGKDNPDLAMTERSDITATVEGKTVLLTGKLRIRCIGDRPIAIGLPFTGLGLSDIMLGSEPAPLNVDATGLPLAILPGKGVHTLSWKGIVSLTELRRGGQQFGFSAPPAAAGKLTLVVPGDQEIHPSVPMLGHSYDKATDRTTAHLVIGKTGALSVALLGNGRREDARSIIVGQAATTVRIEPNGESLDCRYAVNILRRGTRQLSFSIPEGWSVISVQCPGLVSWRLSADRKLNLHLQSADKGSKPVFIRAVRTSAGKATGQFKWTAPQLKLVDADADRGYVLVVPGAHWNIRGETLTNARREDIQNAAAIPGLIAAKVGRLYLYWGGSKPWSIGLAMSPVTLKRECEVRQLAHVGREEVTLKAQFKMTPLGRELYQLTIQLPKDAKRWELQSLRVNREVTGFNHRVDANGRLTIELHGPVAVEAVCQVNIELRLNADWEKALASGEAKVAIPLIHCEAEKTDAVAAISTTSDLQVACQFEIDSKKPVRTGELASLGLGRDVVSAFRYTKAQSGTIQATVVPRRPQVSADSTALIAVDDESLIGRFQTAVEIKRAGIKQLYILVDKSLGRAWKISLSNAVLQSRTIVTPGADTVPLPPEIAKNYELWRLALDETATGKIGIDTAYRIPLLAKDGNDMQVRELNAPLIRPVGVGKITEALALQAAQQLKTSLTATAAKVVDRAEVDSPMLRGRRILATYQLTTAPDAAGEQPSFTLKIERQPQCELPSAIVEKLYLTSCIDVDHSQQTLADITLVNSGRAAFDFELPGGVDLFSASVAGQQSKPQTTGKKGQYRLPLPKGQQRVDIKLLYRVGSSNSRSISVVAPKVLGIEVHDVRWTVLPPVGYRVSSYDTKFACREYRDERIDPLCVATIFPIFVSHTPRRSDPIVVCALAEGGECEQPPQSAEDGKLEQLHSSTRRAEDQTRARRAAPVAGDGSVVTLDDFDGGFADDDDFGDNTVGSEDSIIDVSDEGPMNDDDMDGAEVLDVVRQDSSLVFHGPLGGRLKAGRYTLPVGLVEATEVGRSLECRGTGQPELRLSLGREYSRMGIFAVGFGLVLVAWALLVGRGLPRMRFLGITLAIALALRILNVFLIDVASGALVCATIMGGCEVVVGFVQRRRQAKAAAGVLLLFALVGLQSASAQDGVIVPYDGDANNPAASSKVLVPYARFIELWRKANPDATVTAPALGTELSLSDVRYQLRRGTKQLELRLTMNVRTGKNQVMLPLPISGVAITDARLDGKAAPLRMGRTGMVLALQPNTQGQLLIIGQANRKEVGSRGTVRLQLPPLPAPVMTVDLGDENLELEASTQRPVQVMANAVSQKAIGPRVEQLLSRNLGEARWQLALGMARSVALSWRPKAGKGAADRTLVAEAVHNVYYYHWGVVGKTKLNYGFAGGKRDRFEVYVPAGYEVTTLTGPNLRDQHEAGKTTIDNEDFTVIDVRLHRAAEREYSLTLGWMAPLPAIGKAARLLLPRAGRVATEKGRLRLHTAGGVRLRTAELVGGRRVGRTNDISRRLAADGAAQLVSYYWPYRPFSLKLLMNRESTTKTVTLSQLVRVGWDGVQLLAQCEEIAESGLLYGSSFRIPQGYDVLSVSGAQVDAWHLQRVGNEQRLQVGYRSAVTSAKVVAVMIRENVGIGRLNVPSVSALSTDGAVIPSQSGRLAVQLIDSFEGTTASSTGLLPVPPRGLRGWLSPQQLKSVQFAYNHSKSAFALALDIKARPTRIEAETLVGLVVQPNSANYTYLLRHRITGSPVDHVTFTMPADLARRAIVEAPAKRATTRVPIEDNRVRWTVSLQHEVTGIVDVTVNFSLPIADKTVNLPVPVVAIDGAKTNHTVVAVQNMSRHELKIEQEGLREMPMQERANVLGKQIESLQFAYHTFAAKWSASLPLAQAKDVSRIPIIIDLMAITTVVDSSGNVFSKFRLSLDNRSKQFLAINLPSGARLLGARVAKRAVKPVYPAGMAKGQVVLIPLSIMSLEGQPVDVELWLRDTAEPITALSRVRPPRLAIADVPIKRTTWTLKLPKQFRYMRTEGNMSPILGTAEVMSITTEAKIGQLKRNLKSVSSYGSRTQDFYNVQQAAKELDEELAKNKSYLDQNRDKLKIEDYHRLQGAWEQQSLTAARVAGTIKEQTARDNVAGRDVNWHFNDIADNSGLSESTRNGTLNEMPDFVKQADKALIANITKELNKKKAQKAQFSKQIKATNQPVHAENVVGGEQDEKQKEIQQLVENMDIELQNRQDQLIELRDQQLLLQKGNVFGGRRGRRYGGKAGKSTFRGNAGVAAPKSMRRTLDEKLDTIVISRVGLKNTPVTTVFEYLKNRSRALDPEGIGANILVVKRWRRSEPTITLNLRNTSLRKVLKLTAQQAGLTMRVDEHAIVMGSTAPQGRPKYRETQFIEDGGDAKKGPMHEKLETIVINKISFENTPVTTVFEYLKNRTRVLDPSGVGVNFLTILGSPHGNQSQPAANGGFTDDDDFGDDDDDFGNATPVSDGDTWVEPTITLDFDNIPLGDAIRYICEQAQLRYKVEQHAIVIMGKDIERANLELRFFPIDPSKARNITNWKGFFESRGVSFPNMDDGDQATLTYDERTSKLIVRNSPDNVRLIGRLLAEMGMAGASGGEIDGWLADYQRASGTAQAGITVELPSLDTVQLDFSYPGGEPDLSVLAVPKTWFSFGRRLIVVLVLGAIIGSIAYLFRKRRDRALA